MAPSLNENPAVNAAPPPRVFFEKLTWLLMKNSGLPDYKFRAKFLELAKDADISQKDWCHAILQKIDSKKMFKLAPMRISEEELSKFIGLCERQLRPLYPPDKLPDQSSAQYEKLGSSSLLDLSTPLPKNPKLLSENSNDLDSLVRIPTLLQTDYMSSEFKDHARHAILMNRKVLMTARPNVAVSSKNIVGICFHDSSILTKVGDTAGYDTMGRTVCVAGFEADGRPFFETFPELIVRSEDGKRVFRIGYDANGKPIHALFDKYGNFEGIYEKGYIWSKPTERFEGYIGTGNIGDNDKGLLVDDMR
ncbi:e29baf13-a43f-487c-8f7c-419e101569bb-CDS [Sclerotinia trifoliorum]|uniref:E29baf13-a43f-487c-8f7c-419e101569bb-CDS n=1 Tax=Sclerotinia trifoliorum TaxID=28548 RepID=A0A8H2W3I9_9HELO|nr:e29baf13-a43f-487c-8f7c-419e101569bb-CDS [Sclerotinia trifoliorum]